MMLRALLAALVCLALAACQADDASPYVNATFALDVPEGSGEGTDLRNAQGIFDLQSFPAFIALTVTGSDMERVSASWPETPGDMSAGEQTVELFIDVPAGEGRKLQLALFVFDQDRPQCYVEGEPTILDLAPGSDKSIALTPMMTGSGWLLGSASEVVDEVWLVDAATAVRLDRAFVDAGQFKFDFVCAGRDLTLAWVAGDGTVHYDPLTTFSIVPGEGKTDLALP